MKKTMLEWFEEAKANGAEWADKAIKNTREMSGEIRLLSKFYCLSSALSGAFIWADSPQKLEYWATICDKIEQEEEQEEKAGKNV